MGIRLLFVFFRGYLIGQFEPRALLKAAGTLREDKADAELPADHADWRGWVPSRPLCGCGRMANLAPERTNATSPKSRRSC